MRTKVAKPAEGKRRMKSRSGCKACKARKIKCDEAVPNCQQCIKRKVQCPGYAQIFTWSTRHERSTQGSDHGKGTCSENPFVEDGHPRPAASITRIETSESTTESWTTQPTDLASAPLTFEFSCARPASRRKSVIHCRQMEGMSCTSSELHNSPEHSHEDPLLLPQTDKNSLQIYDSSKHKVCLDFWEPSPTTDLLLCSPAAELHYFGQIICRHLFVCDANDNPMRNVTVAQVRCSALYCALLRYLTAEYLNRTIATDDAQQILQTAKTDTLFQLQKVNLEATSCRISEEVLLATMMFGLSASWDGANHTGVEYYRQALSIFHQAMESKPRQKCLFYEHALMYWWSGLAFVIDSTTDVLPGPPVSSSLSSRTTAISAHPLAGISPQSYWLMGQVGALIHSQRTCMFERSFLSRADIRAQERMICQSQQLEQALLSLRVPASKDLDGINDVGTPAADLCNIAEAYQLCALLLLYRCFPDLLHDKLALEADLEQTTADQYIARCALEALNVIERNGVTSRTRSVEQLLLLIIAGELRLPNQEGSLSTSVSEQEGLLSEPYPPSEPLAGIHNSLDTGTEPFSSTAFSSDLSTTPFDKAYAEAQQILAARALVCTRMSAVRSILPYRSVEQAEELMWDTWWKSDNGKQTFWMDVMIRNGQRFVMV